MLTVPWGIPPKHGGSRLDRIENGYILRSGAKPMAFMSKAGTTATMTRMAHGSITELFPAHGGSSPLDTRALVPAMCL